MQEDRLSPLHQRCEWLRLMPLTNPTMLQPTSVHASPTQAPLLSVSRAGLADSRLVSRPSPPLLGALLVERDWWLAGPRRLQLQPSQPSRKHLQSGQRTATAEQCCSRPPSRRHLGGRQSGCQIRCLQMWRATAVLQTRSADTWTASAGGLSCFCLVESCSTLLWPVAALVSTYTAGSVAVRQHISRQRDSVHCCCRLKPAAKMWTTDARGLSC